MSDMTSDPPTRRRTLHKRDTEYAVYFTLIFVFALPWATVAWARDVFRKRTLNLHGPLARAWAEADRTTPLIFSV